MGNVYNLYWNLEGKELCEGGGAWFGLERWVRLRKTEAKDGVREE
jgi:hypothetical protein